MKKIKIKLKDDKEIEMKIIKEAGEFCIHYTPYGEGIRKNHYTVSHIKSGMSVIQNYTGKEALALLKKIAHIIIPEPFNIKNVKFMNEINKIKEIIKRRTECQLYKKIEIPDYEKGEEMLVYTVTDHTGEITKHLAVDKEGAIQAHLIHFGLLYLKEEPLVSEGVSLSEYKKDRSEICWELGCALVSSKAVTKEKVEQIDSLLRKSKII